MDKLLKIRLIKFNVLLLLIISSLSIVGYYILHRQLNIKISNPAEYDVPHVGYIFNIAAKENFKTVLTHLKQNNILSILDYYSLNLYAKFTGLDREIKVGEYLIPPGITNIQLLTQFVIGKVFLHKFTIVEGLRYEQTVEYLNNHPAIEHTLNSFTCKNLLQNIDRISMLSNLDKNLLLNNNDPLNANIIEYNCNGLFMPDTYLFPKGTKDVVILQQAYDAMQNKLHELWFNLNKRLDNHSIQITKQEVSNDNATINTKQEVSNDNATINDKIRINDNKEIGNYLSIQQHIGQHKIFKSSYEVLILASIIEKETSVIDEMPRVSGVYHRRLTIGIPLQADPTVIYGLKIFDRIITRADLKIPSKYNTYLNKGLPPGPIATPSIAAIVAALHPYQEDFLYFVADGSGRHIFSRSLLEHNQAIQKIRNKKNNIISDLSA